VLPDLFIHQQLLLDIMAIAKWIPDEPSMSIVQDAFDVLSGIKSFELFSENLPPNLSSLISSEADTHIWKNVQSWVDWWRCPQVLKKLCKAYSSLKPDEWANAVESINQQRLQTNVKAVSPKQ